MTKKIFMGKPMVRLLIILTAFLCFILLSCHEARAIGIQAGIPDITPNIERSDGTVIGFAGQEWWVIGYNGSGVYTKAGDADNVTLFLKSAGTPYDSVTFRTRNAAGGSGWTEFPAGSGEYYEGSFSIPSDYNDSSLHRRMTALAWDASRFPARELALINARTLIPTAPGEDNDQIGGVLVSGQRLWPLSQDEWLEIDNDTVRSFGTFFWMRSPYVDVNAIFGFPVGRHLFFNLITNSFAVRPAFNLNLSSVLFTSAASADSGKNSAVPGELKPVSALSGAIKFTVETADASFLSIVCTDTVERVVEAGDTVSIVYTGAQTGANKFVSCVIEDSGGILFYGKMINSAAGTINFVIPAAEYLPDGAYTIKLFNEECNGDNETDFASVPALIPLTVYNPWPMEY
jgi:hypothetical protein